MIALELAEEQLNYPGDTRAFAIFEGTNQIQRIIISSML